MPLDVSPLLQAEPVDQTEAFTSSDEIAQRYLSSIINKTILITGVSPFGIGSAIAASLATGSPKLLILAGRSLSKITSTIASIYITHPTASLIPLILDLSSLSQITTTARSLSYLPCIDIIINNAGIMAPPYELTVDGYESQFAVNHLGHFQLTRELLPLLQASPEGGRVVNVSSGGHRFGGIRFGDLGFGEGTEYEMWKAYGQSKTANILHALELGGNMVSKAAAVNPGNVQTLLLKEHARKDVMDVYGGMEMRMKTPKEGASTVLRAALDPSLPEFTYLEDCQITKPAAHALGAEDAARLWKISEEMVDAKVKV